MIGRELQADGTFADKILAPGYGELYSAHEALKTASERPCRSAARLAPAAAVR